MVIYGTKDSPDEKNRAAASAAAAAAAAAATTTTTTTVASAALQPQQQQLPKMAVKEVDAMQSNLQLDSGMNGKQPNENRQTSLVFSSSGAGQPIPVVSSGAAARHCRPGHWDSTGAVCLSTCSVPLLVVLMTSSMSLIAPIWRWLNPPR